MAGKLDQSLDDILQSRRQSASRRGRGGRRVPNASKATVTVAPVGGIAKNSRTPRGPAKATNPVIPTSGESKIIVNGLPSDVTEPQIKDYFGKTIGPVKRAHLTYGPNGQSRGIATIVFAKPESAVEAATTLNGVKVDNRAMKIEVIVSATQAPAPAPARGLGDRMTQPKLAAKSQPKPAKIATGAPIGERAAGRGRGGRGRRGGAGRPKPKTADELDAEMTDYFGVENAAVTGGDANGAATLPAAAAAVGGDTGMEDEIM